MWGLYSVSCKWNGVTRWRSYPSWGYEDPWATTTVWKAYRISRYQHQACRRADTTVKLTDTTAEILSQKMGSDRRGFHSQAMSVHVSCPATRERSDGPYHSSWLSRLHSPQWLRAQKHYPNCYRSDEKITGHKFIARTNVIKRS